MESMRAWGRKGRIGTRNYGSGGMKEGKGKEIVQDEERTNEENGRGEEMSPFEGKRDAMDKNRNLLALVIGKGC